MSPGCTQGISSFPQLGILIRIKKIQLCSTVWPYYGMHAVGCCGEAGLVEVQVGSGNYTFVTFAQRFHLTGSTQPAFLCSDAPGISLPFQPSFSRSSLLCCQSPDWLPAEPCTPLLGSLRSSCSSQQSCGPPASNLHPYCATPTLQRGLSLLPSTHFHLGAQAILL